MGEVRFMISEAAKQVNVESHVLRYWEEELALTIGRTEMGHRYYTKDDIQLFCCIKKLKNEGMLLKDLKPLIPELKEKKSKLKTPEKEKTQLQTVTSETGDILLPLNTIDQMRALVGDVFREALNENNSILKNDISSTITTDVIHEMDFILEAKERRFGKLPEKAAQTAMAKTAVSAAGTGKKDTGTATDVASGKEKNNDWKQNRPIRLKFTFKEQREYETIDDDIAALEEKIASIDDQMMKNATNSAKLAELMVQKEETEAALEEKTERWVYLTDLAERIEEQNQK